MATPTDPLFVNYTDPYLYVCIIFAFISISLAYVIFGVFADGARAVNKKLKEEGRKEKEKKRSSLDHAA